VRFRFKDFVSPIVPKLLRALPTRAALDIDRFIGTADFISSRMAFNLFAAAREVDAERCSPSDMKRSLDAACEPRAFPRTI